MRNVIGMAHAMGHQVLSYPMYGLIRASLDILMEGNPSGVTPDQMRAFIQERYPASPSEPDWVILGPGGLGRPPEDPAPVPGCPPIPARAPNGSIYSETT
jgi:hypothetical protein